MRAGRERVFEVATRYDAMHESMPDIYSISETRSRRDNVSVVRAKIMLAETVCSVLAKHTEDRPNKHEMVIIGGDRRGSRIIETYNDLGDSTRVTIRADIQKRRFYNVSTGISKTQLEKWLERVLDSIEAVACT